MELWNTVIKREQIKKTKKNSKKKEGILSQIQNLQDQKVSIQKNLQKHKDHTIMKKKIKNFDD